MTGIRGDAARSDDSEEDGGTEGLPAGEDGYDIFVGTGGTDAVVRSETEGEFFGVLAELGFVDCVVGTCGWDVEDGIVG